MSKQPFPLEDTPSWSKWSRLTESSTSQNSGSSSELPETPTPISTVILVTPTITGTSVTKVESPQLPEDTRSKPSETSTQVVQQEVHSQHKVAQQEITFEPEYVQPEVNPKPITIQSEATSKLEVVQEAQPEPVFLLPEHLDLEIEQSKVVTIPKDNRRVQPQISITIDISRLPQ